MMKTKLLLAAVMTTLAASAMAIPPTAQIPEPSTIGLFAAAAIAIVVAAKLKK